MKVVCKTITGRTLTVEIEPSDTIENLKKEIAAQLGDYDDSGFIVMARGFNRLKKKVTLENYGMDEEWCNGGIVQIVMKNGCRSDDEEF